MQTNGESPPEQGQATDDQQDGEPEPQKRVNLLVDDIQRHHAEGVVVLDRAGRSVLVEEALGHLRKDHVQDVHLALKVVAEEVQPEQQKLAAEEAVRQVDLQQQIEQTEDFAADEFGGKVPVQFDVLVDSQELPLYHAHLPIDSDFRVQRVALVNDEVLALPHILTDGNHLHAVHQRLDAAPLQRAPEQVGAVEGEGLQEEHEWHPLVVRVVADLVLRRG